MHQWRKSCMECKKRYSVSRVERRRNTQTTADRPIRSTKGEVQKHEKDLTEGRINRQEKQEQSRN